MKNNVEAILCDLINRYPELSVCKGDIEKAFDTIRATYASGGKLLACGNGGSAADSAHIVGELMKGFRLTRRLCDSDRERLAAVGAAHIADGLQGALPSISLMGESALVTAFLNDCSPELIYAQQVYGLMKDGDTLLCLSTSGNSLNVLNGALTAKAKGGSIVSITGESGGKLADVSSVIIKLPSSETYIIQEYTLPVYHALCAMLEEEFFG